MKPTIAALVAFAAALTTSPVVSATQIVNAGILTGATGVIVDGISYDVTLVGGTCRTAFAGCGPDDLDFHTPSAALAAAQALYDQVFIDSSLGDFRSDRTKTLGCYGGYECQSFVLYGYFKQGNFAQIAIFGATPDSIFTNGVSSGYRFYDDPVDEFGGGNFARFAVSAEQSVPEPATWMMMVGGFGLLGCAMRYRQRASLCFT